MTTRDKQLTLTINHHTNATVAEIKREYQRYGQWWPDDPVAITLDSSDFSAFATAFNAASLAKIVELTIERDSLKAQLDETTLDLQIASSQLESARIEREALRTERDTLLADLTSSQSDIDSFRAELVTKDATISEMQSQISSLLSQLPWNPRIIDASAFVKRIQPEEMLMLFGSADPNVKQIAGMIQAYKTNDWPILMDSPDFQQAIGYLVQSGLRTEERAKELMRDSTREEAYTADA